VRAPALVGVGNRDDTSALKLPILFAAEISLEFFFDGNAYLKRVSLEVPPLSVRKMS